MTNPTKNTAVMAPSGGMDSTSLLLHLLSKGYEVQFRLITDKSMLEIDRASSLILPYEHNIKVRHHIADLTSATALFDSTYCNGC